MKLLIKGQETPEPEPEVTFALELRSYSSGGSGHTKTSIGVYAKTPTELWFIGQFEIIGARIVFARASGILDSLFSTDLDGRVTVTDAR